MTTKKQNQIIEIDDECSSGGVNLTVTSPKKYLVIIAGTGILFNKMPDLSAPKTESKNQEKVSASDRERANWKEKAYTKNGNQVILPGENIHQALKDGCKYWGQKIPGEGNKTFTDLIASAVICEDVDFGVTADNLVPFGKNANKTPTKKAKSMVYTIRPYLNSWEGVFAMHVFDSRLSITILKTIITYAGTFKGVGDWRPTYGRFELKSISEVEL